MALSGYVPAMENPLFMIDKLTNMTVTQTFYPIFYNVSSHVNLSVLPNNLASLTFNSTDPFIEYVLPLASIILNKDAVRMPIFCIYPLSGAYDKLSRALFYVLMIFSLLFQQYKEISIAALVTAMTYAAVSAVHALALVVLFGHGLSADDMTNPFSAQKGGDPDLYGLFPILAVSGIMLAPILMWSSAVRDHHGQAVIISWGILILAALGAVVGSVLQTDEQSTYDVLSSFALCTNTSPSCRSFPDTFIGWIFPRDVYNNCGCMDFCSTYSPTAPMRKGANMVAWSTYDSTLIFNPLFNDVTNVGIPIIVFIVISGVFGLLESWWSPEDVRNGIFAFINRECFTPKQGKNKGIRIFFAKCIAALVFLTNILVALLAPVLLVFAVVIFELYLMDYPQSEHSDAVGAWGTCVGATLVLLATVIAAYQSICMNYIRTIFGYPQHRKSPIKPTPKLDSEKTSLTSFCSQPFKKAKAVTHSFKEWWKDPERIYAKRQHQKEQEREIKLALYDEKIRHQKETARLNHCVRELRSEGHLTHPKAADPPISISIPKDINIYLNDGASEKKQKKPFFYDGIHAYPSSSFQDATFLPISSRSFLHSPDKSDIGV